ncbi:MAG: type II toxin-antitoxin system RelE/ParE family toxin [Candidatus Hinthialibacter antarcticus]|nr:type II toxin-antitoxin system RelE/ParE family toxin [Candidatus Hinthialibacter antarcticus]
MRIFKTKVFSRFVKKERILDSQLAAAIEKIEKGQVDADLGGGVIKQRLSRSGQGKSGGYRAIVLLRFEDKAFYVYGFAKNELDNISPIELKAFKALAKEMLNYDDDQLKLAVDHGALIEVKK